MNCTTAPAPIPVGTTVPGAGGAGSEGAAFSCLETPGLSEGRATEKSWSVRGSVAEPSDPSELEFRSDGFLRSRELRRDLLLRLRAEEEDDLADKLATCGTEVFFTCTNCSHLHRGEQRCDRKWCPVCARALAARRVARYEKAALMMASPMHVTLTRANLGAIHRDDVLALKKCAKKFRDLQFYRDSVRGGVQSVELTNTGKGWHPHLHQLIDCEWLADGVRAPARCHSRARKKELCRLAAESVQKAWSKCIGQLMSSIAIRRCDGATAIREVLKYAVKGSDLIDSPDRIGDAIRAISGQRLSTPFGSLYALREGLRETKRPPWACPQCSTTGTMIPQATVERIMAASRRGREKKRR